MDTNDIYLELTGRMVTEVLSDNQISHPTRCLINCYIEAARKNEFKNKAIIVPVDVFISKLPLEQQSDIKGQINHAIVELISINLIDKYGLDRIMPLIDRVTNFGNNAFKLEFSEYIFAELKHEYVVILKWKSVA